MLWEGAAHPAPPGAAQLGLGSALTLWCCGMSNDGAPTPPAGTPRSVMTSMRDTQGDECWSSPGWKRPAWQSTSAAQTSQERPEGFPIQNSSERKLILSRLMPHIGNLNESTKWKQEPTDPGRNKAREEKANAAFSPGSHVSCKSCRHHELLWVLVW